MGIDNSTRVVGDFKTPLSIMRETAGEDKELEDLNNTVNQLNGTGTYRECHSTIAECLFFSSAAAAAAESLQSCPTLCDPTDGSPPGSAVPGILQAKTLEWVAISFSNAWKWSRSVVSDSSQPHGLQLTRLLRPWDFPGKSTGVGCHCLLHFSSIHRAFSREDYTLCHKTSVSKF